MTSPPSMLLTETEPRELFATVERREELVAASVKWQSVTLSQRQLCDLELLMNGGFAPLTGFMGQDDYEGVVSRMRLADGTLWPIPITLDVTGITAASLTIGEPLALRDDEGVMLAVLHVEELWTPDLREEAQAVFASQGDGSAPRLDDHPGVRFLLHRSHPVYIGGTLEGVQPPVHYDYRKLRHTPKEVRHHFRRLGWQRVVGFQTRNPMHRAHQELTLRAVRKTDAGLLIHPAVGMTRAQDVSHHARVNCYRAILPFYPQKLAMLSLLPLAMRMAGPREALWHALIRKNYGCTHFIVGRDHAGPGHDADGIPFYDPDEAQALVREHENEIGVTMVPFKEMVYVRGHDRYYPADEVPAGMKAARISGTEQRRRLRRGISLPVWFTFPAVERELQRLSQPRKRQGFTVFLTGLSGAGKSTIARVLVVRFREMGDRVVTLLDGDVVRKHLSSELGFSRKDRDTNVRRIGFVAAKIAKGGGIAICAPIAPYNDARNAVRAMTSDVGGFVLVYVSTPLDVCEKRDRKGLYAKARAGVLKEFTGISDPYEPPEDAEVVIDTTDLTPEEAADEIILHLKTEGYIGS